MAKVNPTTAQLNKLWQAVEKWCDEYKPSCGESCYQVDSCVDGATELAEEVCKIVGFYKGDQIKRRVKGLQEHRFKHNPDEKAFAEAWANEDVLRWLLGDGFNGVEPSNRDCVVAATVIQWLGSPVGQCFLRDRGFVKKSDTDDD